MIKGREIICISNSDWAKPWGSNQQLMSRLSSANRVLYVEYQASWLHFSLWHSRFKASKRRQDNINQNLFIFTPPPSLPFRHYFRVINRINQRMLWRALKKIVKKLGFKNPILWIYTPSAIDLLDAIDAKLILYHCIADFPNEKKNNLRKKIVFSMEEELVQKSDLVLVLTDSMCQRFKTMNRNTYLFQSAVDDKLFSSSPRPNAERPLDLKGLRRPLVGAIGYLDGRVLDVDLLCYVADSQPEWSVLLIGPEFRHTANFRNLRKRKNIHFLGGRPHGDMPRYVSSLDVCMIPYRLNEFTNNVSPLKLYEYLAAGKPVVSTKLAGLADFKDIVRIADTKEGFIKEIALSLTEDDQGLVQRRRDAARENSWERRLQFVSGLMEKMDENRKG